MVEINPLSDIYWKTKIRDKETVIPFKGKAASLQVEISTSSLAGFIKISKNNPLSKLAILSSVFSFILTKYFDNYQHILTIYPYSFFNLKNPVFIDTEKIQKETFKSILQDISVEIREVFSHGNYNRNGFDATIFSNFSVHFGKPENRQHHEISLFFEESTEKTTLTILYSPKHPDYIIDSVLKGLRKILTTYHELLNDNLSSFSFLTEREIHQLDTFNNTRIDYPPNKTVVCLFEEQVLRTPDNIAITFNDKNWSYDTFNKKANQLADFLRTNYKIDKNDLVGIQLDRSEKMLIAIFGILKAGAAYVPIDVNYPKNRVDYIISDGSLKLSIDDTVYQNFEIEQDTYDSNNIERQISTDQLAYCIYTSGSTGNPKGVLNHHAGLYNRLVWMKEYLNLTDKEVFLQKTPYTFDVSVWELILPFMTGSKLVILKPEAHKDAIHIQHTIEKQKISIIHFVPSMLGIFLQEAVHEKCQSLSHVVCSGEELTVKTTLDFKTNYPSSRIHNLYGPTEAAIDVTAIDLTDIDIENVGISIGKPVANTAIYIVNDAMQLQPIGVPGELLISGVQVARGYLNLPELTQARFIPDPFRKGYQVYRTGDIAHWNPDGTIKYIGRIDNQVKIRGNRIELGEIENAIIEYGDISSTIVTPKEINGQKVLVAYYVASKDIDKTDLRNHLLESVPEFMIPGFYVSLSQMPLTNSGKIDRKALPDVSNQDIIRKEYVKAGNQTEELLVEIWEEVLNIRPVGITDNFFELGGDSIIAIRLLGRINKTLSQSYKLSDLYHYASIQALLSLPTDTINSSKKRDIKEKIASDFNKLKDEITDTQDISAIYPMSDIELGMIYESLSHIDKGIYHDQFIFPVPVEDFDLLPFSKAVELLVDKHEILRTKYDIENYSTPVHLVYYKQNVNIHFEDISYRNKEECYLYVNEFMIKERSENPFNISQSGLWRMHIYKTGQKEWHLLFQFHHAILDGWSVASLITELTNTYIAIHSGQDVKGLTKLNSNYKDYVLEQHCIKNDEQYSNYWKEKLEDHKKLDIFSDSYYSHRHNYVLKNEHYQAVLNLSKKHNLSIKTITLAAYIYALKMLSYDSDVLVGLVTNGRPLVEDGDKILGCFLNTVPFRIKEFDHTNGTFLQQINDLLIGQKDFEDISLFELTSRFSNNQRRTNPFFDTHFNYIDFHIYDQLNVQDAYGINDNSLLTKLNFETTNTFLDLTVRPLTDGISISWNQQRELRYQQTVENLHNYFLSFLVHLNDASDNKLDNISILSTKEKELLVTRLNATHVDYPANKTVICLFEEQVLKTPDNIAITFNDKNWSYDTFNKKANQLADFLRTNYKIDKNDLVGIQLDRSEKMLIAIFGILKAGAAYVPIDVNYPKNRVDYIISDGGLKLSIDDTVYQNFEIEQDTYNGNNIELQISTDQLAYCIYTSGSTGNPKGVLNHHAGLYNRLVWMKEYLNLTDKEVFLQKTPYTFDVSVWELILPFMTGSKLVILKPEAHKDAIHIQHTIEKEKISIIHFVPSMLGIFLQEAVHEKCQSLSHVVCSGEELTVKTTLDFKTNYPSSRIHNLYGPTEAAIDVTAIDLTNIDIENVGISIGKPVANTAIYIVNDAMQLQPMGVQGELLISGVQVARGYLNLPELTQARFISDPFRKGYQVYRTGDIAHWNPDGTIKYIGRIDNQVKIRGNRIELGEIENAIIEYGDISSTIVTPKEINGQKVLVAYYVASKDIDKTDLRNHLLESVPEFMIPGFYVSLSKMPLTNSGKIDRKALPDVSNQDIIRKEYVKADNQTEEQLIEIWEEILNIQPVGTTDNFFELGGTSFQLIKLQRRIDAVWPNQIQVPDLFEFNSISEIANSINKKSNKSALSEKEALNFFEI